MKKWFGMLILFSALLLLLSAAVLADDSGFKDIVAKNGFTLTPVDSVKLQVTSSSYEVNGAGYYLIVAQSSKDLPTDSTIYYIDQKTGSVSFTVYPDPAKMKNDTTYTIYIYSNVGERVEVGTFGYNVPYTLGDVNSDGEIDSGDATMVLQDEVGLIELDADQKLAGNVNGDTEVDSGDASMILQYEVGLITSWT